MKVNPYQAAQASTYTKRSEGTSSEKQIHQQEEPKSVHRAKDTIDISNEAKTMQTQRSYDDERQTKLADLKQQIEKGTYEADLSLTAKKMLAFWTDK
ncbi:flagellar biosynthesis anti-sigma factor FlgM [Aureibacillus halotolerans]|uniref:Negative regulator of flagellin synthesis n=1 Tax=Aureibacillus halotolerans TaxID=1508390 RepID=A0A4V6PWE7_9BACI|nr:flagellar biosynthesis anti-sigma factor FlgM [Aureibacillus halotolerans]TDQ36927.1 FlgM family anti-sigma-28 factor [Aureibacillus halotolerans]